MAVIQNLSDEREYVSSTQHGSWRYPPDHFSATALATSCFQSSDALPDAVSVTALPGTHTEISSTWSHLAFGQVQNARPLNHRDGPLAPAVPPYFPPLEAGGSHQGTSAPGGLCPCPR